jgi:hypothetical protein
MLRAFPILALTWALHAEPKELAQYPDRVALGTRTLAAEFMIHSISTPKGVYVAEKYLVVDAALFGEGRLLTSAAHFKLRINGARQPIFPQTPEWVAVSIKDPAWANGTPQLTMGAGVGNAGVTLGGPPRVERFPGDPTARRPQPAGTPAKVESVPTASMEEQIQLASMPEGERRLPSGGLLYFAYKGKVKSLKSVELLYEGPAGEAGLRLTQ